MILAYFYFYVKSSWYLKAGEYQQPIKFSASKNIEIDYETENTTTSISSC